jgi:hypothetical protein
MPVFYELMLIGYSVHVGDYFQITDLTLFAERSRNWPRFRGGFETSMRSDCAL